MRIKSIHIKGLFATFDHFIPFNQEDRITIIHAPNGFGKTIILKMLYGLLKMDFAIFEKIPFKSFLVTLDNKIEIKVLQKKMVSSKKYEYEIEFSNNNEAKKIYKPFEENYFHNKITFGDSNIINIYNSDRKLYYNMEKEYREILRAFDKEKNNLNKNNSFINFLQENDLSNWFISTTEILPTHFIETQRLLMIDESRLLGGELYESSDNLITKSVEKYATELKEIIENTLNEYATTSQNLERTFPNRLITQKKQENLTIENIKNELNNLEERRKKLQEVGLWDTDTSQDMNFQIPENTDSSSLNVLNLYIQDAKEKLAVFDGLEQKIALFKNIINSRFQFKTINIDKKKGFFFLTHKNENLDSNDLSSGEQHQLVLLYEMLFKVKENDLVLLDEPEISLHITWQEKFLEDLVKIIELNPFDVVITTHAPEIINDRWDLTVGLSKPKENA